MPNLIAYEFLSLDGRFEGPKNHEMDFVNEAFIPAMEEDIARQYETIHAFVMGRKTFDRLATYWLTPAARGERLVNYMNERKKLVLSSNRDVSAWSNSEHLGDDPFATLGELRRSGTGDMMVIGSARVVETLTARGMIDEYRFLLFPVVVGGGRPLFNPDSARIPLELIREHRFENGVLALDYRVRKG